MSRRGRVGRGNRIIIDRVKEEKPLYGNQSQEYYRGRLPMASVRVDPTSLKNESIPKIAIPGMDNLQTPSIHKMSLAEVTSVKRSYDDVMHDQNTLYYNLEALLALQNESLVSIKDTAQFVLKRNCNNDQIEFFL